MKRRIKEPKSLNKRLLTFIILCWLVPIVIFVVLTTFSYQRGIIEKSEHLMEDQLENAASFASIRIGDAITLSQRPSYEKAWENAWNAFALNRITKSEYLQEVNISLKGKFYLDERFDMYAFYCEGEEDPQCFSSRIAIPYRSYVEEIQPQLQDIIDANSSYAYVRIVNGRLFIIRNLYTTSEYTKYGTLVVELNKNQVFKDVSPDIRTNMMVFIEGSKSSLDFTGTESNPDRIKLCEELKGHYDGSDRKICRVENDVYNGYLYQERHDTYHIGVILSAKRSELYSGLYELYTIVAIMLLLFVPVISYGVFFLRRQIQIPVDRMLQASKRMEEGEIGITVSGGVMPNAEFKYLKESFDSMSLQVKYLFDCVYDEKLARKDAQIQALQAQINPHFLNNTLEMMNWQARMSGDMVVSKMIESLGTVLDYRMNRANVKEIHLAEELQCTDAYLYIMSMRFGQRLQIEKEIDDELLYIMVPPLILQPIVENAIVHGVETTKNGIIKIKVYHNEEHVYLQILNTGKAMTDADRRRIREMLGTDEGQITKVPGKHTSIGIRNVNRRIKLVYGEEYGLTIEQNEELVTFSTITIPYHAQKMGVSLNERSTVQN